MSLLFCPTPGTNAPSAKAHTMACASNKDTAAPADMTIHTTVPAKAMGKLTTTT